MPWTLFWDMHSGGGTKVWRDGDGTFTPGGRSTREGQPIDKIYIEATRDDAERIFYNRFGHSPSRVTCTCCGEDYAVDESPTLEDASGYHRGCAYVYFRPDGSECEQAEAWTPGVGLTEGYRGGYVERAATARYSRDYTPLAEYIQQPDVLVIRADDIKPDQRKGDVPQQGYVWVD